MAATLMAMAETLEHPTALTQSPSFQIERVRRATKDEVEKALSNLGTTMREFWVLTCTLEHTASQTQLSELLAIDASDMVRLIDSLEAHGWVTRERDPKDRRRQIIIPTEEGATAQQQLAAAVAEAEDRALDATTTKQLKHLRKLSQAIMADPHGSAAQTSEAESPADPEAIEADSGKSSSDKSDKPEKAEKTDKSEKNNKSSKSGKSGKSSGKNK